MFVTNKANAEQAGMVAAVAVESLARVSQHSVAVPPPASFVIESGPAGIFKRGDNIVGGEISGTQLGWTISDCWCDKYQRIFFKQCLNPFFDASLS